MAYINAEQVKAIRQTLKETFPKDRFGCRKQDYSSVHITVKKSDLDWSNLFTDLEVSMANEKYMLSLANIEAYRPKTHRILREWMAQNPDKWEEHWGDKDRINIFFTAEQIEYINKLNDISKTAPFKKGVGELWFDKSDSMTDYFHIAWYVWIRIDETLNPLLKEVVKT